MRVTGILSISNGTGLQYPYVPVVYNLSSLCDDVIVGVDPNFPEDRLTIETLGFTNVKLFDSPWDFDNRNGGTEIALQMDKVIDVAEERGSDWVVVMQADEVLHDDDFSTLRFLMKKHDDVTGFSMERLYFWKDLETVRTDWNERLVRVFRPGTYSFMAENTDKSGMFSAQIKPGREVGLSQFIYHYSRVDAPEIISKRVRNMDGLFHPEGTLIPKDELPPYDFVPREYDNYCVGGFPKEVEGRFEKFEGTHPKGIREWFKP